MTKITIENFTAAMRAAVEERGSDYTYPEFNKEVGEDDYHSISGTCQYSTPNGEPACIIGLALSKIDPELVPKYGVIGDAGNLMLSLGAGAKLSTAAEEAQERQDEGATWGEALEGFETVLGLMEVK